MLTLQAISSRVNPTIIGRSSIVRVAFAAVFIGVLAGGIARNAAAQSNTDNTEHWEFRASSGAFVPTGAARTTLKDAALSTAQLSYVIRRSLAVTSTFGWARSRDRLSAGTPRLDAFLYDLGAEFRPAPLFAESRFAVTSFVGAGAGAQSYNYRSLDIRATHNLAGYAAVGGESGVRRVRLRLEVRDYVSGFKPLAGVGESRTHNDVVFVAALRIAKRSGQ